MFMFFGKRKTEKKQKTLNLALRILLMTNGLVVFSAAMLGPIYALYVKDIGGDILDIGLAGAAFSVTAGVVVFLSGKFGDHVKENELVVVAGYVIMGCGFLLYSQVHSIGMLLLVQILIGLGDALYGPSFDALYSKHLDGKRRGTQWGTWESMNYFCVAAGALIGSSIVSLFGFMPLFVLMACLAFTSALYIYHLPRKIL